LYNDTIGAFVPDENSIFGYVFVGDVNVPSVHLNSFVIKSPASELLVTATLIIVIV